jgi:voltage-gated potassium channel
MTIKRRTYEVLEWHHRDRASDLTNLLIVALIGANLMVFTLSTVKPIYQSVGRIVDIFEAASVLAFTAEYSLRLWSCTSDQRYGRPAALSRTLSSPERDYMTSTTETDSR